MASTVRGSDNFDSSESGILVAEVWRLSANWSTNGTISSNLEAQDDAFSGSLGPAMTHSSGVFSFPSTGTYIIRAVLGYFHISSTDVGQLRIDVSIDGGSGWDQAVKINAPTSSATDSMSMGSTIVNVSDTAQVKVRFVAASLLSGAYMQGDSSLNRTHFEFIRLGPSS